MNTVPDGTKVRFSDEAKESMRLPKYLGGLRTPDYDIDAIYTVDNTDDSLHDVILRETGERWACYWLVPAMQEVQP